MQKDSKDYIPALKYRFLTQLYDLVLRSTIREFTFKNALIHQANIKEKHRVLDVGCGTGTLTLLVKKQFPQSKMFGIDGDVQILDIAQKKAMGVEIQFDKGMCYSLPYTDNFFDRVISSLLFHHLTLENKKKTLKEIFRTLRSRGEVHVADWGKPQDPLMRAAFLTVQILDGFETTKDNVRGLLPQLFLEAGFKDVKVLKKYRTIYGTLCLYKGIKP